MGSIASGALLDCEDPNTTVIRVHNPYSQQIVILAGGVLLGISGVVIVIVLLTRTR